MNQTSNSTSQQRIDSALENFKSSWYKAYMTENAAVELIGVPLALLESIATAFTLCRMREGVPTY